MKILFLFFGLITATNVSAQATREDAPNFYKSGIFADFNAATDGSSALFALSSKQLFGIGKNRRFKIGYGLRLNHNFGSNARFTTAPAILTSGGTSPLIFFNGNDIVANIDTLKGTSFSVTSINIPLYLEYAITNKIDVGFNIDLTGLSFGTAKSVYNTIHSTSANRGNISAKATPFNLLLVSDNDLGSLNSEFVVRYHLNNKLIMTGGASFAFAEVTTSSKLYLDNDRFRKKQLLGMIGVSYRFR